MNLETNREFLIPRLTDRFVRNEIVDCKIKVLAEHTDIIRELAKKPKYKMKWSVTKDTGVALFPGPVSDWNELQVYFVYWLAFYSGIEGAFERPPSRVIENNRMLDRWIEKRAKELEDQYEVNWAKASTGISKSAYDADEVYEL